MKLQLFQNPKTEHDLLDFKWFITLISFDKLRRITLYEHLRAQEM